MKTQNFISLAVLASAGLIFAGCTGLPPGLVTTYAKTFRVVSPITEPTGSAEGYTRTGNDHISIVVTFNRSVDPGTVIVGRTLILYFAKDHSATADLQWSDQNRVLSITTRNSLADLARFTPDIHFSLTLKGNPSSELVISGQPHLVVRSADGLVLDGDYDAQPGGDYVASFVILG
jgi:hypothetical protein